METVEHCFCRAPPPPILGLVVVARHRNGTRVIQSNNFRVTPGFVSAKRNASQVPGAAGCDDNTDSSTSCVKKKQPDFFLQSHRISLPAAVPRLVSGQGGFVDALARQGAAC